MRALRERGDEVTVLSRNPERAREAFGGDVEAHAWDPTAGPAPAEALAGRDAVVHLAGENVAQRWSEDAKRRILESREQGTRHLVEGLRAAEPRPAALVSSSAVGYYGPHGDEQLPEDTPPGDDFLARVCVAWEREAPARPRSSACASCSCAPASCSTRAAARWARCCRSSRPASAAPSPAARQLMPWIHADDVVGIYLRAVDDARLVGPRQRHRPRARVQQGRSPRRSAGRCTGPRSPPSRRSRSSCSTATCPRSSRRARTPCRGARSSSATGIAHPDLDEALRSASGRD